MDTMKKHPYEFAGKTEWGILEGLWHTGPSLWVQAQLYHTAVQPQSPVSSHYDRTLTLQDAHTCLNALNKTVSKGHMLRAATAAAGKTHFLFGAHRMLFMAWQEKQSMLPLLRFLHTFFSQLSSIIIPRNANAILLFTQTLLWVSMDCSSPLQSVFR